MVTRPDRYRTLHVLALMFVALLLIAPAAAVGLQPIEPGRPTPAAATPTGMPIPTPQIAAAPPDCAQQVRQRVEEAAYRGNRAADVVGGALPSGSAARKRADEALLRNSQALCCVTYPIAIPGLPSGDAGGRAVCQGVLQYHVTRGELKTTGTYMDNLQACVDLANSAAAAAGSANGAGLPKPAQAALAEVRTGSERLAQALQSCKPEGPAVVAPKPVGGACTAAAECATQDCTGGRCVLSGVAPYGSCDGVRHCGPGLECRDGQCRVPCACPVGCAVSGQGACQRPVPQSSTVRKSCGTVGGACLPPCFRDAQKQCKIDTTEWTTRQETCALVCP